MIIKRNFKHVPAKRGKRKIVDGEGKNFGNADLVVTVNGKVLQ